MSSPQDSKYDIITVGAGHNALVAAAYLARAGKKVLMLERKPWAGGGVSTRELTVPGWNHDEHSTVHIMIQGNPMIQQDELGLLSKFGMEYRYSDMPHATIFDDHSTLITYKDLDQTCESIAKVSQKDAEAYRRFATLSAQLLPMLMSGLYAPPLPMGAFVAMLDQSDEGRDLFEAMQRSSLELADQMFESDKVKIHLVRLVSENLQMPDDLGTGMGLFLMPGLIHTYGVSQPVGGSGQLAKALIRCNEHFGTEIRCEQEVMRIIVSGGKAAGVELATGETILAKDAVISSIHPHHMRQFIEGVPEKVLARGERTTLSPFSLMISHYALTEKVKYRADTDVSRAIMLEFMHTSKVSEMMRDFDQLRRGQVPDRILQAGNDASFNDPSRAPAGKGIFYGVTFAPYDLEGKGGAYWDEVKEQLADRALEGYRKFAINMNAENIVARNVYSPLDMERSSPNSFIRGDVHGAAPYFYQTMAHRPTPDLGNLDVPGVSGLYMVGPFMHPGGGVFGAGRGTAMKMFDDLGMDFDKVTGTPK